MPKTLIRNATILAMGGPQGTEPFAGDVLVEGDRIAAIGPNLGEPPPGATIIDGRGRLVMPGLVNGHLHSSEQFFKGRYEKMPLEVWIPYAYPLLMGEPIPEDLLRLRSLLVAIESLKNGVTTICDCFFDPPAFSIDRLGVVFSAYEDAGIRANVTNSVLNIPVLDTLPYARAIMPADLQAMLDGPQTTAAAYADYCEAAFAAFDGRAGRLRYMVSPSAPQRCTVDLLEACADLAIRHKVPFHTHVLETKTQAVTGHEVHGKTLVRYLHDLGLLSRNVTFAHSVWVTDEDMALMGAAGLSVVHNAISNQKLGAGVAPIRRLLDAGVTAALGTDGASSNDTLRIFDVMRVASLLHGISGPDYARWLGSADILRAATIDGARSAMLEKDTGSLEVGKKADLIVLRMDGIAWTPLNDIRHHLVYCENGANIETVMVDGRIVARDGKLTTLDEEAVFAEVRGRVPAWLAAHAELENRNRIFEPWFAEIHRRATLQDIGINRYAGDMPAWPGENRPRA